MYSSVPVDVADTDGHGSQSRQLTGVFAAVACDQLVAAVLPWPCQRGDTDAVLLDAFGGFLHGRILPHLKGLSVDYEEEYSKYLMQEVSFEPRDNDDFTAQLRLLERWHKKSIPQILEKNRPDAAYAIAMALCKHIPLLINRDDIQELVGEYKRRIGKLIFDSYQALVEAVKVWNYEEKRQEVCRYIAETAGQYPNHRGMKKKLMDLMPETPFEGEPMVVTREPNDMEKALL